MTFPHDGSCLFYAIAFSVLLPALINRDTFHLVYTKLFGDEVAIGEEQLFNLLHKYNGDKQFIINHASALEVLIDVHFRQRLIEYMLK